MVQQTYSGAPSDPVPGEVVSAGTFGDKVREFILSVVKDGTEDTTGQMSNMLFDATDGVWEVEGRDLGVAQSWTPSLESVPSSSADGTYVMVGNMVHVWARFVIDTHGLTGNLRCDLPVAADTSVVTASATLASGSAIGSAHLRDDSASASLAYVAQLYAASEVAFVETKESGFLDRGDTAVSDVLTFQVSYPVASA